MKALKCDRCGKYYEKNVLVKSKGAVLGSIIGGFFTRTENGKVDEPFDLCDDCIKSLFAWINQSISNDKWIPVDAEKPDDDRTVLVSMKAVQNYAISEYVDKARLIRDDRTDKTVWECEKYGAVGTKNPHTHYRVTAWMELPKVYKESVWE